MFQSPALHVVHSYGLDTGLCGAADVGCGPAGQVSRFWVSSSSSEKQTLISLCTLTVCVTCKSSVFCHF